MALKDYISAKIAYLMPVLVKIPIDNSPTDSLLLILTTSVKCGPSLVPVERRAQHRLAQQIEILNTDKLYLERNKERLLHTCDYGLVALASVRNGSSKKAHVILTKLKCSKVFSAKV